MKMDSLLREQILELEGKIWAGTLGYTQVCSIAYNVRLIEGGEDRKICKEMKKFWSTLVSMSSGL